MPRVLCVWFPKWPIQRLRSERPELRRSELVLFAGQRQRLLITVCGPKAERQGVRVGQSLAEAKALIPRATFIQADVVADREGLRQLALDGQRFSPLVGLEEGPSPESLLFEVSGCVHLWNTDHRFLRAVRDYWVGRKFQTRLALADTLGGAWALAHAATVTRVPPGEETAALSDLPVELLRLPVSLSERLNVLGLRTIRDVLRLPRESLASRFGVILPQRLDQALGRRPELFDGERLREPLTAVREWEAPIDNRLTVALICREMLGTLLSLASHPGAGFQELEGELRTEAGAVKLEIRLVNPSRDERHLAHLVDLKLERCAWPGDVVAIQWSVPRFGHLPHVQREWFADDGDKDSTRHVVALVERLSSLMGDHAVLRVEPIPDAQPEHAVQFVPWTEARPTKIPEFSITPEQSRCRPVRLLSVPQAVTVVSVVPDGPPVRVTWRSQDCLVVRCWGPERIASGWWRATDVERDYYRAEWEDGTHAWVFRDRRRGHWFLHGFFE